MTDKLARTLIERLRTGVAEFPIIIENPALIMNEAADKLEAAERENDALRDAAKPALRWMKDWVSDPICECEYGHTCGLTEREDEIKRLDEILNKGVSDE